MIQKLRQRFIIVAMVSMCAVLTVIIGTVNLWNYQRTLADADHILEILADNGGSFPMKPPKDGENPEEHAKEEVAKTPAFQDGPENGKAPGMKGLSPETPFETRYFTVTLSADGSVLDSDTGNIAAVGSAEAFAYAKEAGASGREKGFVGNYRYRKQTAEKGSMYIFVDCGRSLENFRGFLAASAGVSLAGLLAVFLLVIYFSRKVFAPVVESYQKQKRFITDAGHELKTPLTIIDANVEVLEMENGENEWTGSIRNQTGRLSRLTEELVTLSRLDEGEPKSLWVDFSLSDAAEETLETFQAAALASGRHLSRDIAPNLTMRGDEKQIRQLLSLLLDNAVKYADEQGSIEVVVKKRGRGRQITVTNTVSQVPEGSLNDLFERFVRADASRSSQTAGYGIGLSIARAIVHAHKGKIEARSGDGKSFTITVFFP